MFVAWLLLAGVPAPTAPTLQAQFEEATAALVAQKWDVALAGFEAIDARHDLGPRTRGVVLLRKGKALFRLRRNEEAKEALRKGLAMTPKTDAALQEDRIDSLFALGGMERDAFDYVAARRDFEEAQAAAALPGDRLGALLSHAAVTMFDDNAAALKDMDDAIRMAQSNKVDNMVDADIHSMRGRILLNRGDVKGALVDFNTALKDLGGLTVKTDLNDVRIRSDLALAYMLDKRPDRAHEYLEMTGEGRLPDGPFATAARMDLPFCGEGLQPTDNAVVEFGIAEDGSVSFAYPIYASRPGPSAAEFARAVSGWTWRSSEVAKIPLFYRAVTRVEIRCSLAAGEKPDDLSLLLPDVRNWLAARGATAAAEAVQADLPITTIRRELDAAEKSADKPVSLAGWLMALAWSPDVDYDEKSKTLERALILVRAERAPPAVTAYVDLAAAKIRGWKNWRVKGQFQAAIRRALQQPEIDGDARAASVLRLILGSPAAGIGYASDAEAMLQAIVNDRRIDETDPLKVGALARLASLKAQQGELTAARDTFLRTGLSAQQCSLVDAKPAMKRVGVSSDDYPMEMFRLGVSGWTRIEFDVLPTGETANRRAVISYPPFSFGEAAVKGMAGARYTQTYRPQGELGCGGASINIRFVMPKS